MRARLGLLISGIRVELREVKLAAKPAEMLAASPKATVPVLVLPDGAVIDESLDIMRWALSRHDPENWLAGDDPALLAMNDGPFKQHLDRYKYPDRHDSDPAEHRVAAVELLGRLEERLAVHGQLCGPTRTLADMAIMPFVRQFAYTDREFFDALPLPHLQQWLAAHFASPLFEQAMIRPPVWRADDPPLLWPVD